MRKKKLVRFLAGAFLASLLLTGCGQTRIGYIDTSRIMEAPQIKSILDEGNKKLADAQKEAMDEMNANENLEGEERTKKQLQMQRRLQGINQQYINKVQTTLNVALQKISDEQKLDAIVEHNKTDKIAIMGGIDVTDAALANLK